MKYFFTLIIFLACFSFADNKGEFGIEVEASVNGLLSPKLEKLLVKSVVAELPAAKAGIVSGDAIISIEGCAIPGCPARQAKKHMNKKKGEAIHFTVRDASGNTREVRLIAE